MKISIGVSAALDFYQEEIGGEAADKLGEYLVAGWGAYMHAQLKALGCTDVNDAELIDVADDQALVRMWCKVSAQQLTRVAAQLAKLGAPLLFNLDGAATAAQVKMVQLISKPYDKQAASDCYQDGENIAYSGVFETAEHAETLGAALLAMGY